MTLLTLTIVLAGCKAPESDDIRSQPTEWASSQPSPAPTSRPTWQEGKAHAQAMELEIASLIPADVVVKIDQMPTGTLISCSETEWTWYGATTVTVLEGTDIEHIVRAIQAHYENSRFDIGDRLDVLGHYEVELSAPDSAEIYLVSEDVESTQIRISSGSECFTLPEDTWPRGEF